MSRPFRYTFILGLVALATALAAVGGWRYARASAPVNGPIVLISIDSLRADRLPAYGYRGLKTPAIDTLAADGVVFKRAYSHVPQTLPAHVAMLTGQLPFDTGVRDGMGFVVKDETRLLAEMLRDRGFATGAVVSSYALRRDTGINQGFTFFDDGMDEAAGVLDVGTLRRSADASEQIAEKWLSGEDTSRLFLFLHIDEAGNPTDPGDVGAAGTAPPVVYNERVTLADAAVGRLIRYLKTHQLYDRSTIVLVADHGEGLGDHGERDHGLLLYDEVLRIPLIIKPPAGQGAGRRVDSVVQQIDLVPTILDLAKAPTSSHLSGRSLTPMLEGRNPNDRRFVYSESLFARYHFGWSGLTSITDGRFRYIRAPREELYDLENDPGQRDNLAADSATTPAVIDVLRHELKRFDRDIALPEQSAVPPEVRERLEALGYVGQAPDIPVDPAVDPKDKVAFLEQYRMAVSLGATRQWARALDLLRTMLRGEPDRTDLWAESATYATRSGRDDQAMLAFNRILALEPGDSSAHLGAGAALLRQHRLDAARDHADAVVAMDAADPGENVAKASAHRLLIEVALARRQAETAREQAAAAREADSRMPLEDYVEARLLLDKGRAAEALPFFERALADVAKPGTPALAELHYYAGDALAHAGRDEDAELEFVAELKAFPSNTRARVALATLYTRLKKAEEAGETLTALVRLSPTPETYRTAARLWQTMGNAREAAAVRAEAERRFGGPSARPAQ